MALAAALAWGALAAAHARADAIPGAAYSGVAQDGGTVAFTVASDGTSLTSYRISNVPGSTCTFNAEGDPSIWEGAPIVDGWFDYALEDAISFRGTFPGAQSASGTFRFDNHATAATPACDTGTVAWVAATTAVPPAVGGGGSGTPGGSGGSGGSGAGSRPTPATPRFATHVTFRRLSRTRLGGRLGSASRACRAGRVVTLWRGQRRIATARTRADGSFRFARGARVRGRRVRASTPARTVSGAICAAGSSRFIKA
jgi:hypothetical protein